MSKPNKKKVLKSCLNKLLDIEKGLLSIEEDPNVWLKYGLEGLGEKQLDSKLAKALDILKSHVSMEYIKTLDEFSSKFKQEKPKKGKESETFLEDPFENR